MKNIDIVTYTFREIYNLNGWFRVQEEEKFSLKKLHPLSHLFELTEQKLYKKVNLLNGQPTGYSIEFIYDIKTNTDKEIELYYL